jgi:uncharacterized protein (DUF1778 family)
MPAEEELSDEELIARELAEYAEAHKDDNAIPSSLANSVLRLEIGSAELAELVAAAEKTGQSVGAFILDAALVRARELGDGDTTVAEVQRRARELLDAVNRLPN